MLEVSFQATFSKTLCGTMTAGVTMSSVGGAAGMTMRSSPSLTTSTPATLARCRLRTLSPNEHAPRSTITNACWSSLKFLNVLPSYRQPLRGLATTTGAMTSEVGSGPNRAMAGGWGKEGGS